MVNVMTVAMAAMIRIKSNGIFWKKVPFFPRLDLRGDLRGTTERGGDRALQFPTA